MEEMHALHHCAFHGETEKLVKILNANAERTQDLLKGKGVMENTALHVAVLSNNKETAEVFVKKGSSITVLNEMGHMPITYCSDGDMLWMLLSTYYGETSRPDVSEARDSMDIMAVDSEGRSMLHHASLHLRDASKYLSLLFQSSSLPDPLHHSHLLLRDVHGATFVEMAAQVSNTTVLEALMRFYIPQEDAQKELINGKVGIVALMHGHRAFFDQLVALGKQISAEVNITLKALTEALLDRIDEAVHDYKALNELERIRESNLPTYLALYVERYEVFDFLLEAIPLGLTENQRDDKRGRTCLHWAVAHRRSDIVERLVKSTELRLSPGLEDADGKTAMQIAYEADNQEALELLRERPAFREHEDMLFRNRDVYAQALNGILVGAALIGGVSFGSWFQMPASDIAFGRTEMKQFWVCNTVSFFTAVASMCISIAALLPTPTKYVGEIVRQVRLELGWAALALAVSLATVTMAFIDAAFVMARTQYTTPDYRGSLSIGCVIFGALLGTITLFALIFRSCMVVLPKHLLHALCACLATQPYRLLRDDNAGHISRSTYSTSIKLNHHWNTSLTTGSHPASAAGTGDDMASVRKSISDAVRRQLTSTSSLQQTPPPPPLPKDAAHP